MESTLIIATAGLALSIVSLIWQIVTFTRSGVRVGLKVHNGFMAYTDGTLSPTLLLITAINTGRFGTSVDGWGS